MPEYAYEALDKGGKAIRGVVDASDDEVLLEKLRNMGYYPLDVRLHRRKAAQQDILALPGLKWFFHRIRRNDLVTFTRQLATLNSAGLPILRSLSILQEQVSSAVLKDKIQDISKQVENGATLSEAFARHPKVFDSMYLNMVRAGEVAGALDAVLNRIADLLERRQAIIGKVRSAVMYPAVVVTLATSIVSFILIVIIPKFKDIYDQLGAELPWLTQMLIDASYILTERAPWVIAAVMALVFITKRIYRTREGRFAFDLVKLKLPVFGTIFQKSAIARFAGTLSTLVSSGVPILQALDIVRETSGNAVVARAMTNVYESVKDGETIHEPLSRCAVFPPMVCHLIAVGEETGDIEQMLDKVAVTYEREVDNTVNALASLIEPILIVLLGAMIGVIVVALYLPMISLGGHVGRE